MLSAKFFIIFKSVFEYIYKACMLTIVGMFSAFASPGASAMPIPDSDGDEADMGRLQCKHTGEGKNGQGQKWTGNYIFLNFHINKQLDSLKLYVFNS